MAIYLLSRKSSKLVQYKQKFFKIYSYNISSNQILGKFNLYNF